MLSLGWYSSPAVHHKAKHGACINIKRHITKMQSLPGNSAPWEYLAPGLWGRDEWAQYRAGGHTGRLRGAGGHTGRLRRGCRLCKYSCHSTGQLWHLNVDLRVMDNSNSSMGFELSTYRWKAKEILMAVTCEVQVLDCYSIRTIPASDRLSVGPQ